MTADWRDKAACAGADWQLFFTYHRRRDAFEYCDRCPVTQACLDDAMATEDGEPVRAGVRGRLTAPGRKSLARVQRQTAGAQ
jgi:hypothetical protein